MVTVAMFANITTTGRREPLGIELDRDRVGAMIADDFGGDFRATPDRRSKGIDVGLGFLTGDSGPLAFDGSLELFELCIGHTDASRDHAMTCFRQSPVMEHCQDIALCCLVNAAGVQV